MRSYLAQVITALHREPRHQTGREPRRAPITPRSERPRRTRATFVPMRQQPAFPR